jgi:hypothetical protein
MLADRHRIFPFSISKHLVGRHQQHKSGMCIASYLVTSQPSHDKEIANLGAKSTVNGLLHYSADAKLTDSRS